MVVKGVDRQGREFRIRARDYVARIFQHEIDHLDGILFTDRVQDREKIWRIGERNRRQRFSEAVADETVVG